jgi:hypothetical protein
VRSALLGGEVRETFVFLTHNLRLRREIEAVEEKLRRREYERRDDRRSVRAGSKAFLTSGAPGRIWRVAGCLLKTREDLLRALPASDWPAFPTPFRSAERRSA